ncbi:MAG: amino acid adenylation domain-containing protein [Tessaracoccus sp.]|uniref:amino acid adenylation domain-containing protein n=1 Tax=Tessaracoccus sp. TaxID=1971211 RepID=UPI001EB7E0F1|nr:amino acid adenylation domain-containing protein [Tessaracoccus sp.]MBK7822275.1 amino acid adenylation domain-containing protein [Tessaracoccus sp.]
MTWLPLTSAQRGLYFAHELAPENPCYTTAEVVEIDGAIDLDRLSAAHTQAYREFPQLRAEFRTTPEGPEQQAGDRVPAVRRVPVPDDAAAEAWMRTELSRPMRLSAGDVVRAALLSFPDGRTWWFHAAHHVVLDGYGVQQLLRRVCELYDGAPPAEPAVTLAELVADDLVRVDDDGAAAFWDDRLRAMGGAASLAERVAMPAPSAIKRSLELDPATQTLLVQSARRQRAGWPDLFAAAVGGYVARMAGAASARIGVPLMNRTVPGVGALPSARTVCTAMNVLPVTVPADDTVAGALAATTADQAAVRAHPFVRQEVLARRLGQLTGGQLFGAQVNVVPFELELRLGSAVGVVRNLTAGPVEDMTVCLRGTPGRGRVVRLEIDANPELYTAEEVDLHLARLTAWLAVYAGAAAEAFVPGLPLLPHVELDLVTGAFNDTMVEREAATLGERFAAQAARTPDATALVFRGETRTYAQLLDASRRLAAGLIASGVRPGDVVGVALERGFALYEAVHALALLGAVYLPLDADLPDARIEGMLQDARATLVLRPGDDLAADPDDPIVFDDVDAPAYLLFTSGSTGRPKGVLVGHRAIDNRLSWMQHHVPLGLGDRVLHKTPISFDVSVWELFWPLQVGAAVVIAEPGAHRDPRAIADIVVGEGVDVLHFVPSMLRALLADPRARERVATGEVAYVVTSGEALTPDLVEGTVRWFGVPPLNLYGPTEAAVDVTYWDCVPGEEVVPIGRPVWNTRCFVLDGDLRPVPIGAAGELWLGGVQLADGYVGRPDLTAERFVETAFGRLYRTGDLAAWRPDGALCYLGRTDDQVKIRGQRVELGEVEAAVAGVSGLVAAAAGVIDEALVCWYAVADGADGDAVESALRTAAAARLPASFVPAHWVAVPEIPLGTSGKTDRRRLAEIAPPRPVAAGAGTPHDLLEQRLCALVADVVGAEAVGADDDFFALGGDSLRVLRLIAEAEAQLGLELTLADVFAHPTPAGLAALAGADRERADLAEALVLRPIGDRPPLVLLPPAGGLGWCYASLLRALPIDQGVLTVQAPGIADGAPEPVADLDALAARQLAAIRGVLGRRPFHVAGWSLGGMAAHAVARLAREDGQEVGRVVLLDAYPSDQWQHLAEPTEEEALVGILRLGGVEGLLPDDAAVDRATVADVLRRGGSALAAVPEPVLDGCIASVIEASRIVRTSRHGIVDGDLDVVVATAPRPERWLDADGWHPYVSGTVTVHPVDATHGDLVRRPVADHVGAILAGLLR